MTTVTFNSSGSWMAPAGVTSIDCQCWGEGGNGAAALANNHSGGGGGGGEFAEETTLAVTAGNTYTFTIGSGGSSTNTVFAGDSVTVTAHFGHIASGASSGVAGTGSSNSIHFDGGAGGGGISTASRGGGGGGSSAGTGSAGNNGTNGGAGGNSAGGTAPSGGGSGGQGGNPAGSGVGGGSVPGGAGGGGGTGNSEHGGSGAGGQVTLTYNAIIDQTAALAGVGTLTANGGALAAASLTGIGTMLAQVAGREVATLSGVGTLGAKATTRSTVSLSGVGSISASGGAPNPAAVNQWANNYGQGGGFGNINPVLQSCVVSLSAVNSVGGGSAVSTPGNWLFCITSWTQDPAVATAHIGVGDDIHSYWREFPASNIGGMTRTSVSYTPNIARQVNNVYVAPDNEVTAINVLVVEISGLGPWDTLTGTAVASAQAGNYDAAVRAATPQAWWKLADPAGSSTAADSSNNGYTGTPSSVTFGNSNQAVSGNNSASFPSASSAHILTSYNPVLYQGITVEAWVNLNSLSQSGNPRIIANSHTDVDDQGFELMLSGTKPQVWFGNGTLTNNVIAGSNLAAGNVWTHLAGTWDGTTVTLYVNGVSQGTAALAGDLPAGTASGTGIGYNPAYSGDYINGLLAECAVYSGALSAAQILAHYQSATGSASTSITLAHAASGTSFWIAGIGGDNISSGQAFAPSGWTTLATQTQTNGVDHTADNILTSAFLPSSGSSISVSGSASSENLSGFLLGVAVAGTDPVPANNNPNWPYLKFEAAFGGGFNTPNSELTWTDITSRFWGYDETTGIQYQLGQLQATNLELDLDNYDNNLSPENTSSPYYPEVTSGTPLRIRAAVGTIAGVTANRWYVIQRNMQEVPEQIDNVFRRNVPATGTDVWAVLSATGSTPYRGEVYADSPYAWFPCDDQPGPGGVLPTALLNSASGNTNLLNILLSPLGAIPAAAYNTDGSTANTKNGIIPLAGSADYAVAADSGWMYGDPVSTPSSALAGNSITASPGSAAWQAAKQYGNTGSNGWFLSCNDTGFPPLSGGVTVEGWFNYAYFGSSSGWGDDSFGIGGPFSNSQQPYCPLTLIELATSSNPVAVLQLDISGHLNLITYSGSTGTSHSIYSGSDLRSQGWFQVTMTLTASAWTVYLDAGDLATASGSGAGMTSAWTWFIVNADMGSGGGGTTSGIAHGGNVSVSHLAVYPYILPLYRIQAHYWAAITGFGLLPAPSGVTVTQVGNVALTNTQVVVTYSADGSIYTGSYASSGFYIGGGAELQSLAALVTANAGGFTSGPSAWGQGILFGIYEGNQDYISVGAFVNWTGVSTEFDVYTASQVAGGAQAAVTQAQGVAFTNGYGASASVTGIGLISGGNGSSPPATASAIGDTVAQRLERALGYGNVTYPGRCIDPASNLVQAGLDLGGQQAGQNVQNIAISDGGLLFIDNVGKLNYWQRSHLASQYSSPVWQIGPSSVPYDRNIKWVLDPQRAWNAIEIQPYSPTGAELPIITPSNGTAVLASQKQFGAQPFQVNNYLQSTTEMQNQANWLFTYFGQPERRAEQVKIDAAAYPQAWELVLGVNIGDIVQLEDWQIGGGGSVYTYRVTEIKRTFRFGNGRQSGDTVADVELTLDFEPPSYWS